MEVMITRNTIVDGKTCQVNDVVKTDEKTGRYLVAIGKAIPSPAKFDPSLNSVSKTEVDYEPETATIKPAEKAIAKPQRKKK